MRAASSAGGGGVSRSESSHGGVLMVFPLARDLVGCVRQVCKEIRWELLAIQVLQKEYQVWFYQSRVVPGYWHTIRYLKGWLRELHRRVRFLRNHYGLDQVVDDQIRALVLTPEDVWARLPPSRQPQWNLLRPGGVVIPGPPVPELGDFLR